jgi:hypothetical protein
LPPKYIYLGSIDSVLLKLIILPSVARELVLSITVSTGSLRGEEHTEIASDSSPSKSLSMMVKVVIEEEGCTAKGEGSLKISVDPIRKATNYIGDLLACLGSTTSNYVVKMPPTTTIRLLAPSRV